MSLRTLGRDEEWLRHRIAQEPHLLGLGPEVVTIGQEVLQPGNARLDLLLEDVSTGTRYVVELQLESVDESHLERCLAYWRWESDASPMIEHVAVLVAERFDGRLGPLSARLQEILPLRRLQITAELGDDGEIELLFGSPSAGISARRRRLSAPGYEARWRRHPAFAEIAAFLPTIEVCEKGCGFKFNSDFIGIQKNGGRYNFVAFKAWRGGRYKIELKVDEDLEITRELEGIGLVPVYDPGRRWYLVHVPKPLQPAEQARIETQIAAAHLRWRNEAEDRNRRRSRRLSG